MFLSAVICCLLSFAARIYGSYLETWSIAVRFTLDSTVDCGCQESMYCYKGKLVNAEQFEYCFRSRAASMFKLSFALLVVSAFISLVGIISHWPHSLFA